MALSGLEDFIQTWGYSAVFLGACVEGESIIMLSCYMAYQGYLSWPGIISVAFLGTLFADQGLFLVGYRYGPKIFTRWPSLKEKSKRIFDLLKRFDTGFILSFRFIYGIRVASPLILGSSGLDRKRFAKLNVLAAVIWTGVSFGIGYLIAHSLAHVMEVFHTWKKGFLWGILGTILISVLGWKLWRRCRGSVEKTD